MTREMTAQQLHPSTTDQVHSMGFAIIGPPYATGADKELYDRFCGDRTEAQEAAKEFVATWCERTGVKWIKITISSITYCPHGNDSDAGHYNLTAQIVERGCIQ